jgi:hypothetical protein
VRSKPLGFFIRRAIYAGHNILQIRQLSTVFGWVSKNGKALPSCRFINSCPASLCLHRWVSSKSSNKKLKTSLKTQIFHLLSRSQSAFKSWHDGCLTKAQQNSLVLQQNKRTEGEPSKSR